MRLAELLSKAPARAEAQVERFIGRADEDADDEYDLGPGYHEMVDVGKVLVNYFCTRCDDSRTFTSGDRLSCLVVGPRVVSIDVGLRCPGCDAEVEAWFLVTSRDDLTAQAPRVQLVRYVDNRREGVGRLSARTGAGELDALLERAQLAHEHQLGHGSMVYLRIIFESLTRRAAEVADVSLHGKKGGRKPFRELLREVDEKHHIIPPTFSSDGYRLYEELSEVVHGNASEATALAKYASCESLVRGILQNISSSQEMKRAVEKLGWGEVEVA
ncbi:hypothetical protein NSA53_12100 [Cellulosimicrobium cellulans]|uniref:hypothetical protein n=1 Tax=Cellulosimicrobium cellulans TaxID=1710 RepID=UPI00214A4BA7|nr:hypothetical protein [Cellulosimicrobium cellulans]